jgi:hypothetical protein
VIFDCDGLLANVAYYNPALRETHLWRMMAILG